MLCILNILWIPNRMVLTVIVFSEPWLLRVGVLQVQCRPTEEDGVGRLAVSRGLLTCCRPHVLLSPHIGGTEVNILKVKKHSSILLCSLLITWPKRFSLFQTCLLLEGLFPVVRALCEQKLDCHYFAFEGASLTSCILVGINEKVTWSIIAGQDNSLHLNLYSSATF